MAHNEQLTIRVREALAGIPNVVEKRMFRGVSFMVNGKMCISTGNEELMCRFDPELHDASLKKNGVRPVIMKGREYQGYVYIHENAIKDADEFIYWINLSLDFNGRAKSSKK